MTYLFLFFQTSGQILTQYKPSEDLEQVPLLNPNSPSHLSGAMCMPPYPILKATYSEGRNDRDEVDLSCMFFFKKPSNSIYLSAFIYLFTSFLRH